MTTSFRNDYLDYDAMTGQMRAWADAHPDLVRLTSIGQSPEGREFWLLTVGPEPDRKRPSAWVDGNMHASEVAGSSAALAIAEDVIAIHQGDNPRGLSDNELEVIRETLLYVLPRMSPDGAEAVLKTGRYVRSVPRDQRVDRQAPRWIAEDVDGDGLALVMRVEDPTGEFVESTEFPGLLLPRRPEDAGPFYKVWPEGRIEHFDGHHVPSPDFLSDNEPDLNRNFPFDWKPEPEQRGAGAFPTSEPESRAVVEFAHAHPELYAWLNLHTFGGVHIRPRGDAPDNRMDRFDLALYKQLGEWAEALTGYPMVSGFEEFTYEPDTPIRGDLSEFAYNHIGCVAWVTEIWDLFVRIGMKRPKKFVEYYTSLTRADMIKLAEWDRDHNKGRMVRPWRDFDHPQLGRVQLGGIDPRFGAWNPPHEALAEVLEGLSTLWLKTVALAPRPRLDVSVDGEGETRRVRARVSNIGYLPTYVLGSAKALKHNEDLWAEAETDGDAELVTTKRVRVGHLEGWGRGKDSGAGALYFLRSAGSVSTATVEWLVQGTGTLTVRVGNARMGRLERRVEL